MSTQINSKDAYAYAELLEIMDNMEEEQVQKIPNKLMDIFKNNASKDYVEHLDVSIPLEEQDISEETSALLAMLLLNYWCESEEEKQELMNIYNENEKIYQENLREKYNPDNVFSNNTSVDFSSDFPSSNFENQNNEITDSNLPLDYESLSWYRKIFVKFKTFIFKLFTKKSSSL